MSDRPTTTSRRTFLASSAAGIVAGSQQVAHARNATEAAQKEPVPKQDAEHPVLAISSANGQRATRKAFEMLSRGADTLDAVVAGVNIVEDDPADLSVGYGGLPNEAGVVQLDAAVMHGPTHQAGSVACLEGIRNPSKVAKIVLWQTDHVLLVGKGAAEFAKLHGFRQEDLLTERARKIWLRWKQSLSEKDDWLLPPKKEESSRVDSDEQRQIASILANRPTGTIHCAGMNSKGDISCVTTTSGLAFKIPGRVGDSPIIGAGLYVDNEIGSCGSTGRGEANLQNQCCFAAVELMRTGRSPEDAGLEVLRRVAKHTVDRLRNSKGEPDFGLNFYLVRKDGKHAGVAMRGNSRYSVTDQNGTRLENGKALLE